MALRLPRRAPRLSAEQAAVVARRLTPVDPPRRGRVAPGRLEGHGVDGRAAEVRLRSGTLVVFLREGCDACEDLAGLVRGGAGSLVASVLGVVRPGAEAAVRAWGGGRWLVGDGPFEAFGVTSVPFFCLVGEGLAVTTEGVAFGASYVLERCAESLRGAAVSTARLEPGGR